MQALFALCVLLAAGTLKSAEGRKAPEKAGGNPAGATGLRFYAPLDEHARGVLLPHRVGLASDCAFRPGPGKVGAGALVPESTGLPFPLRAFLSREKGSVAVWVRVNWDPAEPGTRALIDLGRFGKLYQWTGQDYLTFALYYHHLDERHDYSCHAPLTDWRRGRWKHVAITWSWAERRRRLYVDGRLVNESPIKRIPNIINAFRIGQQAGTADELCVYSNEIDAAEVARLFQAGQAGRPAFDFETIPEARGALLELPAVQAPVPPSFVNWSFTGAEERHNTVRAEVTLHGWWRWQVGTTAYEPPNPAKWRFRKVPNQSHYGESFPVRDDRFRVVPAGKLRAGSHDLKELPQWCERQFTAPDAWRGRRIILSLDSLIRGGAVYLNGRLLGALPEENLGAEYDVTGQVLWKKPNRLTVFSRGVDGEIRLISRPRQTAVMDAGLVTSWRKKTVTARLELRSMRSAQIRIEVTIVDASGSRIKRFGVDRPLASGLDQVELSSAWPDAKPWSLTHPVLYTYVVTVMDDTGRLLDRTLPTRFGFREIWIEGGDFMLNGRPVHFIGHSNSHLTSAAEVGDSEYVRYSLRRWQAAGLNCVTPWQSFGRFPTYHPLLDISDELGVAILPVVWLPTGERGGETPELRARWERLHERYVKRYRQHPSLLIWLVGSGSHNYDFCPGVLDGRFDADVVPKAEPLKKTWAFVRSVDPTRPVFGLSNGNIGAAWTSMAYQGFDVDLQERENWPVRWATRRHKPLMPCEFSLPCHPDWFTRSRRRSGKAQYHPANSKSIATEYGAMLLGPDVYLKEPEAYLASLARQRRPNLSQAYWDIKLLFADTLRAWRAYGLSFIYHAEVPNFFTGHRPAFPTVAQLDPRRRQATPESLHGSLQAADELSPFGRRVRAATEPLMAYVGGPDGVFTNKDHAYWSGETVRKALVVVNDTDRTVRIRGTWRLADAANRKLAEGKVEVRVKPGGRETQKGGIKFTAPAVTRRTDCRLTVAVPNLDVPVFSLTVFPKSPNASTPPARNLVLFDPVGDTRTMLAGLGIHPAELPAKLTGRTRLIVGRRGLGQAAYRSRLIAAGFDNAVLDGMRVLIFEQAADGWDGTLAGLRVKRLDTRRSFVRCPGHPVLAGLDEKDFLYLRGSSNLIPPYPEFGPLPKQYPTHWWHWGNDHIVATYTLEKPQTGAARAILDCGFDLAETPLLEVARGEGLLVFCQVDVTNRVGVDPVSTRLVANLVRYLEAPEFRPTAGRTLADLRRSRKPTARFHGYFSRTPPVPGIQPGDVFFRRKLSLPAFAANGPTPLFAQVKQGHRRYWLPSFDMRELETEWQRAKLARIEAALRFLHGERTKHGPQLTAPGNLYPHNWNYVPDMKVDFDPYVYWRW